MLSRTEQVWRHLLAGAADGVRRWPSLTGVAAELGMPLSTVHRAMADPVRLGAVLVASHGGVRLLDPVRLAVLWAGRRRADRDVVDRWAVAAAAPEVERKLGLPGVVLGGFGAVVAALGGNVIAEYGTVVVYAPSPESLRRAAPPGRGSTDVLVLGPDPLLGHYGRVCPLHQAWVDLFGLPGWQAARFVDAVLADWLADAA